MKQLSIFMIFSISILLTACNNNAIEPSPLNSVKSNSLTQLYAKTEEADSTKGGNPEVKAIHQCLKDNKHKALSCLNELISKNRNVYISTDKDWTPITLAGRGNSVEKRTIDLTKDDELIVYIKTSHVKLPLTANVEMSQRL